ALQRSPAAASAAAAAAHADQRSVEQLFEHLQRALIAVGYLDPRHPKKLMPRLRRLFSRTRLEVEEVDLLRGICSMMERRR
ncbi:MAG TPA: tRNA (cytosine(32)/uridine(32)-2'-O)-methyltransferase TrmJ, partial [Burkholderiaceae bacterium]|nr:tRNA (cytosine(32)/uridine(32)-2'-O)-methyltransferase TrmJ [Burkholderiaceae bacterium]